MPTNLHVSGCGPFDVRTRISYYSPQGLEQVFYFRITEHHHWETPSESSGLPERITARMSDRQKAIDIAIGQIERQFGKGSIMKMGEAHSMQIEGIPTGSIALDLALGIGGIPRGRITEIYGPESSGKTTLALHVIAEAQKIGGVAAYVDAEHALDPLYAGRLRCQPR